MLKLVVREILSPYGYSKVRNASLRFLWPRTGPHTVMITIYFSSFFFAPVVTVFVSSVSRVTVFVNSVSRLDVVIYK